MSSIRNQTVLHVIDGGLRAGGVALLLAGMALSQGCQKHAPSPFSDVSDRHRLEATQSPAATLPAAKTDTTQVTTAQADVVKTAPVKTDVVKTDMVKPEPVAPAVTVAQEKPVLTPAQVGKSTPPELDVVVADEAGGLKRNWPVSVCYQPSGDTSAGHTYYPSLKFKRWEWVNIFYEPGQFLVNTVLVPVQMVIAPPFKPVIISPVGPAGQEHVLYGQPALHTP